MQEISLIVATLKNKVICTLTHSCRLSCSDIDKSGYVSDFELQDLFREASYSLPGYKVREIMDAFSAGDTNKDEKISFEEFVSVSSHFTFHDVMLCKKNTDDNKRKSCQSRCRRTDLPGAEE